MSELRQNLATGEWVIVAPVRADKPMDFAAPAARSKALPREESCPFCPGNEKQSPPETFAIRPGAGPSNGPGWGVRVVGNKYPALVPSPGGAASPRRPEGSPYAVMEATGCHEVIVEHPRHDLSPASMSGEEVRLILQAYRQRCRELAQDRSNLHITVFRNHGESAGASLRHPHSQLITVGVVPLLVKMRLEEGQRYFEKAGACAYCDILSYERQVKERIVLENEAFTVLVPYAAALPYEMWVIPRRHRASFGEVPEEDLAPWAEALRGALARLARLLGDPDYNYIVQTAPYAAAGAPFYHWHVQIIPRLRLRRAGFEIGSGIGINVVAPEAAARALRG